MLHLKNINVWHGNNHVLRNLSCTIQQGDFIVIVGANGAGKSSFFDTIAGKIKSQSGSIIFDNVDITQHNEQKRAHKITRLFQNTHLNSVGSLTVEQNLALALYAHQRVRLVNGMHKMPSAHAELLVKSLNLDPSILKKSMNSLSGGQRQLVAFVMATLLKPQILLLDEPTAALDPQAATRLLQHAVKFIKQHSLTTLLITHDPHIALAIGNKIWVLENGTISRHYDNDDKKKINPDQLLGQINYAQLRL